MAIKRIVSTNFWTDRKVVEFFTPEDRLFMVYLLTNPHTTQLGIYPFIAKIAAFEIGYSVDSIQNLLDRFANGHKMIMVSETTGEIAIKNYLKHSIVKGGTPVFDLLMKEARAVKDKRLLAYVMNANKDNTNQTVREFTVQAKTLLEPEVTNDNDNENENENDNEDSLYDSCHDSSKVKKDKEKRHKYGEYDNVLLTDTDLAKLKAEFRDWQDRIERLSAYMASTGKAYKNHLATIRNWAKRDETSQPKQRLNEYGLPPHYAPPISD